jgi:Xaa-Pro aminopeptidase
MKPSETPRPYAERLAALRAELRRRELDGFIVPRADEHQGEYVPARSERLAWLTGFTGSAGLAIVLLDRAAIFVDGRYVLQAGKEVEAALFETRHLTDKPPNAFIAEHLAAGRLGYDPWLHTENQVAVLKRACAKGKGEAVACADNPLDAVWPDQPAPPRAPVVAHPLEFAGVASAEKRADLAERLRKRQVAAAVLTLPDSIAWLLNVRGGDVPHTPLPLSFALLRADGSLDWFVDPGKLDAGLADHLGEAVTLRPPAALGPTLDGLGGARVQADPASAAAWLFDRLRAAGAEVVKGADPCLLPKACKNPVEIEGCRQAHRRDGAALTRFLSWLEAAAGDGAVTEMAAAEKLLGLRQADQRFRDLSFDTISGSGPNGAVVHYRVSPESDRRLGAGELYLVDSGAQYLDGTTDVTRTLAIGTPTAEMRDRFTRVLKGHIALARVRFPAGTSGSQLDALARQFLWQVGLDYDHGTGHGVGSYLAVHEGPQRISKLPNSTALRPGMILSDEPGYYKTGAYGIRIENLVLVVESPGAGDEEREMLAFEVLTLAPIDRSLIEVGLLTAAERAWVDDYHARVRAALTPQLDVETAAWLAGATAPLAEAS